MENDDIFQKINTLTDGLDDERSGSTELSSRRGGHGSSVDDGGGLGSELPSARTLRGGQGVNALSRHSDFDQGSLYSQQSYNSSAGRLPKDNSNRSGQLAFPFIRMSLVGEPSMSP